MSTDRFTTHWQVVPNPMRNDGVFIVLDVPPQPYPGVRNIHGGKIMQLPPHVGFNSSMDRDLAEFIVKAVNLFIDKETPTTPVT
jgi:hypothetical protein